MPRLSTALLSEFFGTLLLVLLGDGVVAAVVLQGKGDWLAITTGWALAVTLAVYLSGKASGAHINPAVTLAAALRRGFPWNRVLPYWVAQLAGAFAGAALVYLAYYEAFRAFESANHLTRGALFNGNLVGPAAGGAGVFATYPAFSNLKLNLFSEFLGTLVLVLGVFAVIDPRNLAPKSSVQPLLVGAVVWGIGLSLGGLTGYAINPARDLGPRFASAIFGWGSAVFESHDHYWFVPVIAPLAGGIAGALIYDFAIGQYLPPAEKDPPSS
jgi:MIP family channel proteins